MEKVIGNLFSDYLSEKNTATDPEYSLFAKEALQKERELRALMNEEQTKCFEELFELTSHTHYLEVRDAFFTACKLGAKMCKELII